MKKIIIALGLVIIGLQACKNEADYKVVRREVLEAHDQVMLDGERAIHQKMTLDTLVSSLDSLKKINAITDTLAERRKILALQAKLNQADEQMNDWMHHFKAEVDGQADAEAILYFNAEKAKIKSLDSLYQIALKESASYLSKFKK